MKRRGLCLVIAAPPGAGKTSVSRALLESEADLTLSVSVTTRAWQWWESGKRIMPGGLWELFLIKSDIHPDYTKRK